MKDEGEGRINKKRLKLVEKQPLARTPDSHNICRGSSYVQQYRGYKYIIGFKSALVPYII